MELSILLVFLFGGLLGWFIGHLRGRTKVAEIRRQSQMERVGTREQSLGGRGATAFDSDTYDLGSPEVSSASQQGHSRAQNTTSHMSSKARPRAKAHNAGILAGPRDSKVRGSESNVSKSTGSGVSASQASVRAPADKDVDELYRLAAKVKPLEFDLEKSKKRIAELEKQNTEYKSTSHKLNSSRAGSTAQVTSTNGSGVAAQPQTDKDLDELYKLDKRHSSQQKNRVANSAIGTGSTQVFSTKEATQQSNAFLSSNNNDNDLDELYRISARVKPLEYDLAHRTQEVKALKHALQDVKRKSDKQLVSVRLQSENQAGVHYKEKLNEKHKRIKELECSQ